jgi:hypothetical protein
MSLYKAALQTDSQLPSKYQLQVKNLKELFPDWSNDGEPAHDQRNTRSR